ncbi:(2Fe-2S) ferredoxin domain-containing protein [Ferrovibrio terrae]|uniref:(2Fe-2S) ferredoxin domain-containing protein n=1 Tax=Ferrovibrio terrae TaxID=2594003 RepID=UPI003137ED87
MSSSEKSVLQPAEQPWSTALVLVCSECEGGHGVDLAQRLKDAMKAAGHKKDVRVARVRCLGICPKRGVAVTITGAAQPAQSHVVTGKGHDAVAALTALIAPE